MDADASPADPSRPIMSRQGWDDRYRTSDLVWSAEPNRLVAEHTASLAPGRALDLASGEGRNALWLASRGWTVTAVDFSPVATDKGRPLAEVRHDEIEGGHILWVCDDVRTYQPAVGGFDLVLVAYLQLKAAEIGDVLHRGALALAPGGLLLVVGHDSANLAHGVGGPQDPEILFSAHDIVVHLADEDDLVVDRAEQVLRPVVSPPPGVRCCFARLKSAGVVGHYSGRGSDQVASGNREVDDADWNDFSVRRSMLRC